MHTEITGKIIGIAVEIHKTLGPGLLESVYKECLFYKLKKVGFDVVKEKPLPLVYEEVKLECGYRLDLLVDNKVLIEIKNVEALADIHKAQVLTYLKLGNYQLGLLINFNELQLIKGIKCVINSR